jgi:hypothetical protein
MQRSGGEAGEEDTGHAQAEPADANAAQRVSDRNHDEQEQQRVRREGGEGRRGEGHFNRELDSDRRIHHYRARSRPARCYMKFGV